MAKGKRVQPKHQIEYRLLLAKVYDEKTKQTVTEAVLRTAIEFTSFKYEIVVESSVSGSQLRLNIQGLRAPQLSMPAVGPALAAVRWPDLRGTYDLVVSKLGKEENAFVLTIDDHAIEVTGHPKKRFIDVVTNRAEW